MILIRPSFLVGVGLDDAVELTESGALFGDWCALNVKVNHKSHLFSLFILCLRSKAASSPRNLLMWLMVLSHHILASFAPTSLAFSRYLLIHSFASDSRRNSKVAGDE
jgi:hypothetical protein